jgi:hypothetical protein
MRETMEAEAELKEIRVLLSTINEKLERIIEEREFSALTKLSEASLRKFLEEEPELYTEKDLTVANKFPID